MTRVVAFLLVTLVGGPVAAKGSGPEAVSTKIGRAIYKGTLSSDLLHALVRVGATGSPASRRSWNAAMETALAFLRQHLLLHGRCPGPSATMLYTAAFREAEHAGTDTSRLHDIRQLCRNEVTSAIKVTYVHSSVPRPLQPLCVELGAGCRILLRRRLASGLASTDTRDTPESRRLFKEATELLIDTEPEDILVLERSLLGRTPLARRIRDYVLPLLPARQPARVAGSSRARGVRSAPARRLASVDEPGIERWAAEQPKQREDTGK